MIGLKRGTVKIYPYSLKWQKEFEKEKKRLLNALGDKVIDIQHIGSTSVPGLDAKPIIDLSIGIRRFKDAEKLVKPLSKLGYYFERKFQKQRFFAKGPEIKRTHYLHIMRYNGVKWKNDKMFRDYLKTHPKRVFEYVNLKKRLAEKFPNDRQRYSEGKNNFIKETLALALKSGS